MTHELQQQMDYIRAALEQEKKPLGFLIGAGAPMSMRPNGVPLIPGLEELTAKVRAELNPAYATAVDTLLGHLEPKDSANLESLLNYVRSLAALPGSSDIRGVSVEVLSKLDAEICKVVRTHVDQSLPPGDNPYFALALWVSAVRRIVPTQIFTTNYDLLMEQALERQRVAYFDGFMGSREPSFDLQAIEEDQLPSRWTLLWKLHGSINWSQDPDGNVVRRPPDASDASSALVYPSHLKYDQSRRLPYLAMMDRLKAFMRKPGAILITTGFSFRDQHINEVIDQSLRANPTASVQGLLFGSLNSYDDAVALAKGLPNLMLLAEDAAVVGSVSSPWSPDNAAPDATSSPKFTLGDFTELGKLLRSLTGELPHKEGADE
ncbi:SIR2 family protein [Microbacterium oryzae]|uniref:SIR2 family protein n=1 Tax=Microbacterium oryzae TaxID=743009 RepID=A0A6I6E032_9MICO|nr:SIR2 family protein [Microbacterium oryzae]QGU27249.1 SIR2 family protein [Microbacterium oryzae]